MIGLMQTHVDAVVIIYVGGYAWVIPHLWNCQHVFYRKILIKYNKILVTWLDSFATSSDTCTSNIK